MAVLLLVILLCHGYAASGYGTTFQIPVLSESVTHAPDETGSTLSQGKQRLAQDAAPPSGVYYGLQKAEIPLKHFTFIAPSDEVIPPYADKASGRGCFIKYFYLSIRPQAP